MSVLVTGAAGFIGFHVASALLRQGVAVVGVDKFDDYYDVALKEARLDALRSLGGLAFHRLDVAEPRALSALVERHPEIDRVIHLAAAAGVRHSQEDPRSYVTANIMGHVEVLEACRRARDLKHLVFASTSSVYGEGAKHPFTVGDPVDTPCSMYGATKKADEEISHVYAHLYRLPTTALRFFTVYGPWGRPDMASWVFTKAIFEGKPIPLFNQGNMRRDFTYIDDIVAGVLACLEKPPAADVAAAPLRIYNIGNSESVELERFVAVLERTIGKRVPRQMLPMQPGDVLATSADIGPARRDFGFNPVTAIEVGLPRFVAWYREYHGL
ncbi:MAG: SDR family NAD(P)-dependent oxidoreductase [Stellaceae bacterium]